MTRAASVPVLVVREKVVLPGRTKTFFVGRPASTELLAHLERTGIDEIVVVTQRDPLVDEPDADDLFDIACRVRVVSIDQQQPHVVVAGLSRVRISVVQTQPFFTASVVELEADDASPRAAALAQETLALLEHEVARGQIAFEITGPVRRAGPGAFADLVSAIAEGHEQEFLEAVDVEQRCALALQAVTRAASVTVAPAHGVSVLAAAATIRQERQRRVGDAVEAAARHLDVVASTSVSWAHRFDELIALVIDAEERGEEQAIPAACWSSLVDAADALEDGILSMYLRAKAAGWPRRHWADALVALCVLSDRMAPASYDDDPEVQAFLLKVRQRVDAAIDLSRFEQATVGDITRAVEAVDGGAAAVFTADDDDDDVMAQLCDSICTVDDDNPLVLFVWSVVNVVVHRTRR